MMDLSVEEEDETNGVGISESTMDLNLEALEFLFPPSASLAQGPFSIPTLFACTFELFHMQFASLLGKV